MDKKYDHRKIEPKIYEKWQSSGAFSPEGARKLQESAGVSTTDETFSIPMPPPNANAPLHFGHATYCIEDAMIRFRRMKGYKTCWFPGTDHAGFETQVVFERKLRKNGKSRFNYDRETFYQMVFDFVKENSDIAINQFKKLGMSADWSRNTFMLEDKVIDTVYNTFVRMEKDKMVYRDGYMVNYSPFHGTTFSELETEYVDRISPLYYVKYKVKDADEFLVVATVRPETIYADVAIAVNPADKRYKKLIGKKVINPLNEEEMPVIEDDYVDKEFGTGALKITPAHDSNDFEIGKKHNLGYVSCIGLDGKMNENAMQLEGMNIDEARDKTLEILKKIDAIEKIDKKYKNRVMVDYKDGKPIEPMVLPNWFVKVDDLAKKVKESVINEKVKFNRDIWKKEIIRWMNNIKPWPISRQTVFGIRIPAYYPIKDNPDINVTFIASDQNHVNGKISDLLNKYSLNEIKKGLQRVIAPAGSKYVISKKEPEGDYLPETDTFDTWFSSGQWPLTISDYPNGKDYKEYYPHSVLESGWEIIFFWIARMIMFGLYLTNEVPFKYVYFHNIITASDGKKMSKSRGNVVNPLELVEKYGADAVRMFLLAGVNSSAKYSAYNEGEIKGFRNFGNKLWNVTRFINMKFDRYKESVPEYKPNMDGLLNEDSEILNKLDDLISDVTENMKKNEFYYAGQDLYHFIWDDFANGYLEQVKDRDDVVTLSVLRYVLVNSVKLLHPFMPFITESIWKNIPVNDKNLLIISEWPKTG